MMLMLVISYYYYYYYYRTPKISCYVLVIMSTGLSPPYLFIMEIFATLSYFSFRFFFFLVFVVFFIFTVFRGLSRGRISSFFSLCFSRIILSFFFASLSVLVPVLSE